jgi:putative PIN family toxin of toxin-antitoxin system
MKVFFDTNVYVAEALLGKGAARIMAGMKRGRHRIYVNGYVLDEIVHVLVDYLGFSKRLASLTRRKVRLRAAQIEGHSKARVPDDPKDSPVLKAALACGAHYLVSNDRHLLSLDPYESLRIVSMEQFLDILHARGS